MQCKLTMLLFRMALVLFQSSKVMVMTISDDKQKEFATCGGSSCCYISDENQLAPKVTDVTCYTAKGHNYIGSVNVTEHGRPCINWLNTPSADLSSKSKHRFGIGDHNFCRNPEPTENKGPWCYVSAQNYGYCNILSCISYPPLKYGEVVLSPDCATKKKPRSPDVTFVYNGVTFYMTSKTAQSGEPNEYLLYRFVDDTFTASAKPFVQTIQETWNLCLRKNDILTFATTDQRNQLFLYFQYPNVMVRLNSANTTWEKVPSDVYSDCITTVRNQAKYNNGKEVLIRSVYDFNLPHTVFLEIKGRQYKCQWANSRLVLTSSRAAAFSSCEDSPTSAYFIDSNNISFAIPSVKIVDDKNSGMGKFPVLNGSFSEEFCSKPGITAPLLGYELLRNGILVKLRPVKRSKKLTVQAVESLCLKDGPESKLFQVYFGFDFQAIVKWMSIDVAKKRKKVQIWIHLNNMFTKRSDFCKNYKGSCCKQYLKDFRKDRQQFRQKVSPPSQNEWTLCSFSFALRQSEDTLCPRLKCFHLNLTRVKSFALCEINMSPRTNDQSLTVSIQDMFGVENDQAIVYADADDASEKLSEIADALLYPVAQNNLHLGSLIGSVEALQPVNYSQLDEVGTRKLLKDFVSIVDNLADTKRLKDWEGIQTQNGSNQMNSTSNATSFQKDPQSLLFITENVLKQVVVSGGSDILKTQALFTVKSPNVISRIEKQFFHDAQNTTNNVESACSESCGLMLESSEADQDIPAYLITSTFPNIVHLISQTKGDKNMGNGNITQLDHGKQLFVPNSPVLSATVVQNGKKLMSSVKFKVPFNPSDIPNPQLRKKKYYFTCSYLAETHKWNTHGCHVVDVNLSTNVVTCSCNHTTNFAILLQVVTPKVGASDKAVLSLISYIGESLSVFCLVIALVIFTAFRRNLKSERMVAHFHLVIALIIFHVVQLFSFHAESTKNVTPAPCIIVAVLTHFSLLAIFMWMLCEGITLHLSVVDVFKAMTKFKVLRYIIGWGTGVPFVISAVTASYGLSQKPYPTCYLQGVGKQSCGGIDGHMKAQDAQPKLQVIEWCWLSTENYLIWSLVLPAMTVLVLNTIVLVKVSYIILRSSKATNHLHKPSSDKNDSNLDHIRKSLKGAIILMPILGISWCFGLIPQSLSHVSMLYVFTLLNTTQGIFILLFHCILNGEVRTVVIQFCRRHNFTQHHHWLSQSNNKNQSVDLRCISSSKESEYEKNLGGATGVQRSSSTNTSSTYFGGTSVTGNEMYLPGSPEEHAFISTIEFPQPKGVEIKEHMGLLPPDDDDELAGFSNIDVNAPVLLHHNNCHPDAKHERFIQFGPDLEF